MNGVLFYFFVNHVLIFANDEMTTYLFLVAYFHVYQLARALIHFNYIFNTNADATLLQNIFFHDDDDGSGFRLDFGTTNNFFGCVIGYGYQQHVYNVHTVKSAWLTVNCIHPTPTLPPLHINHQKIVVSSRLSIAAVRVTD